MSKIIEVTVSPKGEATIQTKGFRGPECRQVTRGLEMYLGLKTQDQTTNDFYLENDMNQDARQ